MELLQRFPSALEDLLQVRRVQHNHVRALPQFPTLSVINGRVILRGNEEMLSMDVHSFKENPAMLGSQHHVPGAVVPLLVPRGVIWVQEEVAKWEEGVEHRCDSKQNKSCHPRQSCAPDTTLRSPIISGFNVKMTRIFPLECGLNGWEVLGSLQGQSDIEEDSGRVKEEDEGTDHDDRKHADVEHHFIHAVEKQRPGNGQLVARLGMVQQKHNHKVIQGA